MWSQRKSSQKPPNQLIGRFQQLYGNCKLPMQTDSKQASPSLKRRSMETSSERFHKRIRKDSFTRTLPFSYDQRAPRQPEILEWGFYNPKLVTGHDLHHQAGVQDTSNNVLPCMLDWDPSCQSVTTFDPHLSQETNFSQLWSNPDHFITNESHPNPLYTHNIMDYSTRSLSGNSQGTSDTASPRQGEEQELQSQVVTASTNAYHSEEGFRYQTSLKAPTAMRSNTTEVPVSYLNKGQPYNLTVIDSSPPTAPNEGVRYRTFIHVSFEEEHQRRDPAACWQLWKEGRESAERKKRDLPSSAVQYAGQDTPRMLVDQIHLDGFAVIWTPLSNNARHCSIPVRLNFLSTDFTRLKGVKGDSVRLCVKTEQLSDSNGLEPEISFCNVKLFRDHGAERKMANDVTIIHRRMDKLKLQIADSESSNLSHKRKRASDPGTGIANPTRMNYDLHTSHISTSPSNSSSTSHQQTQTRKKLNALEWNFQSSEPENTFFRRADPQDDPDLYSFPVPDGKSSQHHEQPLRATSQSNSDVSLGPDTSISWHQSCTSANGGSSTRSSISEGPTKPVACFYINLTNDSQSPNHLYRAIYPKERTVHELKKRIIEGNSALAVSCSRIFYINRAGLKVEVDNKFVQHIAEGQDMIVECQEASSPRGLGTISCPIPPSISIYLSY